MASKASGSEGPPRKRRATSEGASSAKKPAAARAAKGAAPKGKTAAPRKAVAKRTPSAPAPKHEAKPEPKARAKREAAPVRAARSTPKATHAPAARPAASSPARPTTSPPVPPPVVPPSVAVAPPPAPVVAAPPPPPPAPPRFSDVPLAFQGPPPPAASGVSPPRPATPRLPIPPLPEDEEGWVPITGDEEDGWEPVASATVEAPTAPGAPAHAARSAIPSLPEDDEFEPIDDDEDDDLPRTAPAGAAPRAVYDAVRAGDLHVAALDGLVDDDLRALATELRLEERPGERRAELLYRLLHHEPEAPEPPTYPTEGALELVPEGFGFLRTPANGYFVGPYDAYVPIGVIRHLGLLPGHWVAGTARAPRPGERYPTLIHVETVNHEEPDVLQKLVPFDRLVVTHPDRRYVLETTPEETAMRVVDLFCPLGRGQRALIVSPPRAGKTILLQKIADSLARNYPEVEIVVLLVDERPEEVTNMRRSVRGEVIASTFDQPPHRHIRVAELAIEKVKRMVELGRHVVLLIDSLTRLGRAYNNETGGAGRLLTGGLEATALTKPKRFFGAARNIEHGGSLTIVASALVDTGSRLDQVIFEEFKGTGNMEIVLSRDIANQRVWPAIDVGRSGTRREDLLLHPEEQHRITALRRSLVDEDPAEAMTDVTEKMAKHRTNAEFLMRLSVD